MSICFKNGRLASVINLSAVHKMDKGPVLTWPGLYIFVIMYMGRQEILTKVTMDEMIETLETF